ncbi:MAG: heparinase II/III family protein [Planctomycetes bacterium]|nr:heparinase II/III family protein [Planctomycetota bacterium]
MRLTRLIHKAVSMPPRALLARAIVKMRLARRARRARQLDLHHPTHTPESEIPPGEIFRYVTIPALIGADAEQERGRAAVTEHYLAHHFDLLGSGWVEVRHGTPCRGVEGHRFDHAHPISVDPEGKWLHGRINAANLPESRRVWGLIQTPYLPIDWQLDFKSGYRWSEAAWSPDIRYGDSPGADVKVPWELARMQHLPQLALAGGVPLERLAKEFRNQVLDFTATNPPRFGVNWVCTMDVAIRAANWLVAFDLLRSRGAAFDAPFLDVFRRALYDHGRHIVNHLEWHSGLRSNHYLANLAGLMFIAAYLPVTETTSAWLALAVQELGREWTLQFGGDGGNFEGSTSYHRLSAEMLVYAAALAAGLHEAKWSALADYDHRLITGPVALRPAPITYYPFRDKEHGAPFAPACWDRLAKIRDFTAAISGDRGIHAQIGDNDSGRFLKLLPVWRRMSPAQAGERYINLRGTANDPGGPPDCWIERQSKFGHLRAAIDGLLGRADAPEWTAEQRAEAALVRSLANLAPVHAHPVVPPLEGHFRFFREFGLYYYRVGALSVALRCGPVGQRGNGGHAHNDQLSLLAGVEGVQVFTDPGTYLYTPAHDQRNRFRATRMHNTVAREGLEQNRWLPGGAGLFSMVNATDGRVTEATPHNWIGEHSGAGGQHRRSVMLTAVGFEVHDFTPGSGVKTLAFQLGNRVEVAVRGPELRLKTARHALVLRVVGAGSPEPWRQRESLYSPAYGWCEASRAMELSFSGAELRWSVSLEAL